MVFDATGQPVIDQVVDRLRAARISIARLEIQRPTLEDTFIRLVGQADEVVLAKQVETELSVESGLEVPAP